MKKNIALPVCADARRIERCQRRKPAEDRRRTGWEDGELTDRDGVRLCAL
jgi:hypothetical protein